MTVPNLPPSLRQLANQAAEAKQRADNTPEPTLEDARRYIREALIGVAEAAPAGQSSWEQERWVAQMLEAYSRAYVQLGGDLEQVSAPSTDELEQAAQDVADAVADLTAEDFPPRLEHLVAPLRELVGELEALRA